MGFLHQSRDKSMPWPFKHPAEPPRTCPCVKPEEQSVMHVQDSERTIVSETILAVGKRDKGMAPSVVQLIMDHCY